MTARASSTRRATGVVMAGILASRVLGLAREQVVALHFGRSPELSAFWAAFKIPNLVRVLLGEGNLSASFIPVLSVQIAAGDPLAGRRTAGVLLGFLLLGVGLFTGAGILLAQPLAVIAAPGFDPALRDLVARLIRILFPLSGMLVLGAWCMGVLHAHGRFFWPNFAPALLSAVSALSLVLLLHRWGRAPIELLAWGTVAGGAVQLLVQVPGSLAAAGSPRPSLDLSDPGFRRVLALFAPMLLGTGVAQINGLVETQIASFLDPEAVATLQYAVRLYTLPLSLFGTSVAMAALPALSRDAGRDAAAVGDGVGEAWLRALFFLVPSTVALVAFGEPLVRLVFERGAFTGVDTDAVTRVLALYSTGLIAFASVRIFAGAFYALEDSRTPVRLSVLALGLNTLLSIVLARRMGTPGIALASSLAAAMSALLTLRALLRRTGSGWLRAALPRLGRLAVGGAAGLGAAWLAAAVLPEPGGNGPGDMAHRALTAAFPYAALGAAYLLVCGVPGVRRPGRRPSGRGGG
ncbi:MAG: murein biosynthesis integral membrane protein MurJ [Gemmatimonadetes bacterium]|nr:murein biosynthesis integral membrane protein MurJ [Gemmatimonadota bacterium]